MSTPSAYQKVVTQYDITEAGVPSIAYANYDNTDDILPITLPAITGGTVALVGLNGIWIEEDWDYAGGTLNIGPTTIAGLPAGILDVVGDLCAVIINDRAWTAAERAGVVAWGKARGAPGVFSLGPELVTNGTFDTDTTGWVVNAGSTLTATGGNGVFTRGGPNQAAGFAVSCEVGKVYLMSAGIVSPSPPNGRLGLTSLSNSLAAADAYAEAVGVGVYYSQITASATTMYANVGANTNGLPIYYDNISVRKLELLP